MQPLAVIPKLITHKRKCRPTINKRSNRKNICAAPPATYHLSYSSSKLNYNNHTTFPSTRHSWLTKNDNITSTIAACRRRAIKTHGSLHTKHSRRVVNPCRRCLLVQTASTITDIKRRRSSYRDENALPIVFTGERCVSFELHRLHNNVCVCVRLYACLARVHCMCIWLRIAMFLFGDVCDNKLIDIASCFLKKIFYTC